MQLSKLPHYIKKVIELGPVRSYEVVKQRVSTYIFETNQRKKAYNKTASHSWQTIVKLHNLKNFDTFFAQLKQHTIFNSEMFELPQVDIKLAQRFVQKTFTILGSQQQTFTTIPWHTDFRLQQLNPSADASFDKNAYYKDIIISAGPADELVKDIKVPWELSRCEHLLVLGQAYETTHDARYAQAFQEQIEDWLDENPYLLGPNWVCPMDVGIRAANWVIAFDYFKNASMTSETFWQRFVCSLYDHLVYLEHNWEVYDSRTSNHYLSDLVGYLYLCVFFQDLQGIKTKYQWCVQEIIKECDKQIFDEGSDYEGSTRYHVLVAELFYHAYVLMKQTGENIPTAFEQKIIRMFNFIYLTQGLNVGDHDSGTVIYCGITSSLLEKRRTKNSVQKINHFASFGLSVIIDDSWRVSLRHHAYHAGQPSGHFHNDAASITLAVDGVPIVVDPGSYMYTSSSYWRNYFRSVASHNTFYLEGHESVPFDERLFGLNIPEATYTVEEERGHLYTSHRLYDRFGLTAHRAVDVQEHMVRIIDWWEAKSAQPLPLGRWNFTFDARLVLEQAEENSWIMLLNNKALIKMYSPHLTFNQEEGWVSYEYGVKHPCKKLTAGRAIAHEEQVAIIFEKI